MEESEEPKNCWEVIKCTKEVRENCLAYKKGEGVFCSFTAGRYCLDKAQREVDKCPNCPWFKKNIGKIVDRLAESKKSKKGLN